VEWTWITVLEGFVLAAETAALIAAGRRAGYQRSSNTIRRFAAAMDSFSASLPRPSQLPHLATVTAVKTSALVVPATDAQDRPRS
jgi:hypothetical protein